MLKRFTAAFAALICCMSMLNPVYAASKLNIVQDFENFVPDSVFSAGESGYKILSEDSSYLSVESGVSQGDAPVLNLNYSGNFTFEFEAKNSGGQQAIIQVKFADGNFYDFFTLLGDGRGPILRTSDNSPYFFYNTTDTKPSMNEWHRYRIDFNYTDKTLTAYVDDVMIEKYYDRNYSPAVPTFSGAAIEKIRFYMDATKSGSACYDNVYIYAGELGDVEFEDDFFAQSYMKLSALDAIPASISDYEMETKLTRGEFVELVMQTLGLNLATSMTQIYADVPASHPQFSAINMAQRMEFIALDENFRPDDYIMLSEAVTIICNINNYNIAAELQGGWPNGYMVMAYKYNLLDNINVISQRQYMNLKDSFILMENALTAPEMVLTVSSGQDASYAIDESINILWKYHKLIEIECYVDDCNIGQKSVSITDNDTGLSYYCTYDNVSDNLKNTMQYVWFDENYENIAYMYSFKNSALVWGYITEVNSSEDNDEYTADKIKRVAATNCVRTALSEDAIITLNGAELTGTVYPINMFSRIAVTNGKITRIDLFELIDGGLIETASSDIITYQSGIYGYSQIEDIGEVKPMRVIVNNNISTVKSLRANMYFDYIWLDDELTVVASDVSAEGTLKSISSESITVETEDGERIFDKNNKFYIAVNGENDFSASYEVNEFLNAAVVIYTDAKGYAKFMRADTSAEFYGIVVKYNDEPEDDSKYPYLTVARIENGSLVEREYKVNIKNKTLYYPEVGYYEAVENRKDTEGRGVYKFTAKNGTITKIESIEWYNNGAVTLGDKFDYRAVRVYFDGSWKGINPDMIFLLKDVNGEFEVQKIEWANLTNKFASGAKALVAKTEPIADIMILTEYENAVYQDANNFGFIEDINEYCDEDDAFYTSYEISLRDSTSTLNVLSDFKLKSGTSPIEKFDYMMYSPGSLNKYNSGIVVKEVIKLSKPWEESTSGSLKFVHLGQYSGVVSGYIRTLVNGEEKYVLLDTAGYSIYSTNSSHTKFKRASKTEMYNEDLWAITIGDIVRAIYFED